MPESHAAAPRGMPETERPYWAAFNHVPGIGPVRFATLLATYGTASVAWRAQPKDLAAVLDQRTLSAFLDLRRGLEPTRLAERLAAQEIELLLRPDPGYPPLLAAIDLAPFALYYQGRLDLLQTRCVAVVGTRRCTSYGRRAAADIAGGLAAQGVTIVSGLARGIDAAAHEAALSAGNTVAVLGTGLDQSYPISNARLQREIAGRGAVVSEYPPGSTPEPGNFPARNRIVSGLSTAAVIIEAGRRSGALLTARLAADQGRDVLAVPGPIYATTSEGTNQLLADGAGLARSAADVLTALGLVSLGSPASGPRPALRAEEQALMDVLVGGTWHIDDLARALGRQVSELGRTLSVLEIAGHAAQVGGQHWTAR